MITIEEKILRICEEHKWPAVWFRLGCVVVKTADRVWQVRTPDDPCPNDVEALGCSGWSFSGRLDWVGIDLDIGHGTDAYKDVATAIEDARRFRDRRDGRAEIRLSKSGNGVHIRCLTGPGYTKDDAKKVVLGMMDCCWMKADATPLGRQVFFLWARDLKPRAFELIEGHAGVEYE